MSAAAGHAKNVKNEIVKNEIVSNFLIYLQRYKFDETIFKRGIRYTWIERNIFSLGFRVRRYRATTLVKQAKRYGFKSRKYRKSNHIKQTLFNIYVIKPKYD